MRLVQYWRERLYWNRFHHRPSTDNLLRCSCPPCCVQSDFRLHRIVMNINSAWRKNIDVTVHNKVPLQNEFDSYLLMKVIQIRIEQIQFSVICAVHTALKESDLCVRKNTTQHISHKKQCLNVTCMMCSWFAQWSFDSLSKVINRLPCKAAGFTSSHWRENTCRIGFKWSTCGRTKVFRTNQRPMRNHWQLWPVHGFGVTTARPLLVEVRWW